MGDAIANQGQQSNSPAEATSTIPIVEPSASEILVKLSKEREANEKAVAEMRKLVEENNKILSRNILGGSAYAGTKQEPPKTKQQLIQEKADAEAALVSKKYFGR